MYLLFHKVALLIISNVHHHLPVMVVFVADPRFPRAAVVTAASAPPVTPIPTDTSCWDATGGGGDWLRGVVESVVRDICIYIVGWVAVNTHTHTCGIGENKALLLAVCSCHSVTLLVGQGFVFGSKLNSRFCKSGIMEFFTFSRKKNRFFFWCRWARDPCCALAASRSTPQTKQAMP